MQYGLSQEVVDSIINLSKEFQLTKTILFGSRARGDYLDALLSRNHVAHAYNEDIALDIINKTKSQYVLMFETLLENLKEH